MEKFRFTTKSIVNLALLTALEIVLSRFLSFSVWNAKIGFSFVPVAVAAMLYGPLAAGITAAVADFLGAVLFPIGPYFPGFTLTAFLMGIVLGLFLRREQDWRRIAAAVVINQFILGLFLNTYWISVLFDSPFGTLFPIRAAQSALLTAIQIPVIHAVAKLLKRYGEKVAQ